jgi:hypothetical protein
VPIPISSKIRNHYTTHSGKDARSNEPLISAGWLALLVSLRYCPRQACPTGVHPNQAYVAIGFGLDLRGHCANLFRSNHMIHQRGAVGWVEMGRAA